MGLLRHLGYGMFFLGYPTAAGAAAQISRTGPTHTRRQTAANRPEPPVWHPDAGPQVRLTAEERHSLARHEEQWRVDTSDGSLESTAQRILITAYLLGCPATLLLCAYVTR